LQLRIWRALSCAMQVRFGVVAGARLEVDRVATDTRGG
jgi:hypothetical protein